MLALQPASFTPRHKRYPVIRAAPLRTVGPSEHSQRLALRGWSECPECQKVFVNGAIVTERQEPIREPLAGYTGPCVLVKIFCNHCDAIFTRLRATNAAGQVGDWIGAYGIIRDPKKINAFLTVHPEAKGVE